MNDVAAALAATMRVRSTSVASIDNDASTATTIVAGSLGTLRSTDGRANQGLFKVSVVGL